MTPADAPNLVPLAHIRDAIDTVFVESVHSQARRLSIEPNDRETPGQWIDRVRKAALLAAVHLAPGYLL